MPTPSLSLPVPKADGDAPASLWALFVRGWRPACGWAVWAMLMTVVVARIVQVARGQPPEPIAWTELAALFTLVVARSVERTAGVS